MARIPAGENLGGVIARPQRFSEVRIADGGMQALGAGIQQAAYAVGQANELEKVRRDAADRATAMGVLTKARDDLATLHDDTNEGVRTGQIDKTKATDEWTLRTKDAITAALQNVPQSQRDLVQKDLDHTAAKLSRGVRKAVELRDQSDTLAGIDQTLEYAQRLYIADPKAADQLANDTLDGLGPFSGLSPAQLQAKRQGFKEGTRFNFASSLVNDARRDNAKLDKVAARITSDEFSDMDPARRTHMLGQIEAFKVSNTQQAEAAIRRREAEEERRLNRAQREFDAATSIITTGKVLSPEYVQQVTQAVAGTPYERAFQESLKQAPEKSAFGMQPLATMDRLLSQARAELNAGGTNPHAEKKIKELELVRDQAAKDYAEDPLLAAQERGIIQSIQPVNTSSVASVIATIGDRVNQASLVQTQVGQPVSPFLRSEAEAIGKTLSLLPVDQRSTALAQISTALGPAQSAALARQMAPKDKALGIALGMAGAQTTNGRYTSELVLRGAAAIKDKAVKEDNAALSGVRARVAAEIGDAYVNQELRQTMIDAAVYAEYGLQSEGSGDLGRAVRLVTGGITERGGKKVPLPYGMDAKTFEKRLVELPPDSLAKQAPDGKVYVAGTEMKASDFLKQVPTAALLHAGQGRYAVQTGTGLATNAEGRPLIIEVK